MTGSITRATPKHVPRRLFVDANRPTVPGMKCLSFGDVTVDRLVEAQGLSFHPNYLLPDSSSEALAGESEWLEPHFFDPGSGRFIMSLHTYVIRTPHHVILVDTCVGNDKDRPSTKPWDKLNTPYLANLGAMGVNTEEVDYVLCTHLHVDHVGWNTKLENGRWVPTFPNARYLFHQFEYDHWENAGRWGAGKGSSDGCFEDSVLPVMEAGQADLVAGDYAIDDSLWLEPSPGHSPGHVCLNLEGGGRKAVFTGDVFHHPCQCAYPEWSSRFCFDPGQSSLTREHYIDRLGDTDTLVLAAHFASPVTGRIVSNGARCRFQV